ncbi:MAG: DUF551 domain-containing protein [Kiritimatiellales bacterium]
MKWIEVSKLLPNHRKDVLLFCAETGEWDRGWWDEPLGVFIVENTGSIRGVTHWADVELPEVQP